MFHEKQAEVPISAAPPKTPFSDSHSPSHVYHYHALLAACAVRLAIGDADIEQR